MRLSNVALVNAWNAMPLHRRLAILAESILESERAQMGVSKLIAVAAILACYLSGEARVAIADQFRAEADMLAPPLDRRALN